MLRLVGNATLAQPRGINLIEVMAHGIEALRMSLTRGYGPMPAFRNRFSAAELAELANDVGRFSRSMGATFRTSARQM